jgi:RND superfamily putative drug exporter
MGRLHGPTLESPGSPSARAVGLVAHRMPQLGSEQMILAFDSSALRPQESLYQGAMSRTALAVATVPGTGRTIGLPVDAKVDPHHAYLLLGLKGDLAERQRLATVRSAGRGSAHRTDHRNGQRTRPDGHDHR